MRRTLRVALIRATRPYLNPGLANTFQLMQESGYLHSLTIFDLTEAAEGPTAATLDRFDAVMIDGVLLDFFSPAAESDPENFSWFTSAQLMIFEEAIHRTLESRTPSLLLLPHMDLHGLTSRAFQLGRVTGALGSLELFALFDAVAWPYESGVVDLVTVPPSWRDPWMSPNPIQSWTAFKSAIPVRVHLPFALGSWELSPNSPRKRWDVAIPGARYATRRIASDVSRASGCSVAPHSVSGRLLAASEHFASGLPGRSQIVSQLHRLRHQQLRRVVSQSQVVWVDGSALGYPVRKFLEIPAWSVPMVTLGAPHLEDLGFEPGHHYLASTPEEFADTATGLLKDPVRASKLGTSARRIVEELHSANARSRDLWWALEQLALGNLGVARYRNGRLGLH